KQAGLRLQRRDQCHALQAGCGTPNLVSGDWVVNLARAPFERHRLTEKTDIVCIHLSCMMDFRS
ncbi:MAG: hypothetical protein KGR68_10500, partial [Betaproteobacteria bacterium]|nr:hypothetical protein [Betaproteobacteria bacterium]